jgi:hypothetical protein
MHTAFPLKLPLFKQTPSVQLFDLRMSATSMPSMTKYTSFVFCRRGQCRSYKHRRGHIEHITLLSPRWVRTSLEPESVTSTMKNLTANIIQHARQQNEATQPHRQVGGHFHVRASQFT